MKKFLERINQISERQLYVVIVLIIIAIRAFFFISLPGSPFDSLSLDGYYYHQWAIRNLRGLGFGAEAFYGYPLYPLFLTGIYFFFGAHPLSAQIANIIVCALNGILIYQIGRLSFTKQTAVIAAFLYAGFNMSVYYSAHLNATSISTLIHLSLIRFVLTVNPLTHKRRWLKWGMVLGLGMVLSGFALILLILIPIWVWVRFVYWRRELVKPIIFFILAALIIPSATTFRNYFAEKVFVPVTYHHGITFFSGNNSKSQGSFALPHELGKGVISTKLASRNLAERELGRDLSSSEISRHWFQKGIQFIQENPLDYLRLLTKKFYLYFWVREIPETIPYAFLKQYFPWPLKFLPGFFLIMPLSLIGIFITAGKRSRKTGLLFSYLIFSLVMMLIYFVNSRYKMVAAPILILFCAEAIRYLAEQILQKNIYTFISYLSVVICLAYILNIRIFNYNESIVYNQVAISFAKKGIDYKAEDAFKKAIALRPNNPSPLRNYGQLLMRQGRFDESIDLFQKVILLNPNHPLAYTHLGTAYYLQGDFVLAEEYFQKSLSVDSKQQDVIQMLEKLRIDRERTSKN